MVRNFLALFFLLFTNQSLASTYAVHLRGEGGFSGIISHQIQFGESNRIFSYVKEGGQDVLVPFARFSADIELFGRHLIEFVYQPIYLQTNAMLKNDAMFDDV